MVVFLAQSKEAGSDISVNSLLRLVGYVQVELFTYPAAAIRITSYNVCYTKLLRGKHRGDIVDGAKKAELLKLLAFT